MIDQTITANEQHKRKSILVLDFDGVIHSYASGWQGAAIVPDPPVPGAIPFIVDALKSFRVAILSSRSHEPGGIDAMRGWLLMFMMAADIDPHDAREAFDAVEWPTVKPPAVVTIDDRALTFDGTWPSIEALKAFQPWNQKAFVRVYRLPQRLTDGFCHGSGVPITFLNVDWFETPIEDGRALLEPFIQGKRYFDPSARFLVLSDDPTLTFTIEPAPTLGETPSA